MLNNRVIYRVSRASEREMREERRGRGDNIILWREIAIVTEGLKYRYRER